MPRNRGRWLEEYIDWACKWYRQQGLARLDKVPTPMKVMSRNNQPTKVWFDAKATVDYVGTMQGGRAVAFDVKECNRSRWPLSNLQEHQREYLEDVHRLGGLAFVLVGFPQPMCAFAVPWPDLAARIEASRSGKRGAASISFDDFLDNWQPLDLSSGIGSGFDFLEAATGGPQRAGKDGD